MAFIWGNRTDFRGFKLVSLMYCTSHSAAVPFFALPLRPIQIISWGGIYCQEMWFPFGEHLNKCYSLGPKKFGLKHCRPSMALEQAKPEWPVKAATKQEIFQSFFFHPFRPMEGTKKRKRAERQDRKHTQDGPGMLQGCSHFVWCLSQAKQSKTKGTRYNDATGIN